MADIDKGLPNTRTEIKVPSEEEQSTLNLVQSTYQEQNHTLII
jgi:hypothetical protein